MKTILQAKTVLILGSILAVLTAIAGKLALDTKRELFIEQQHQEYVRKVKDLQRNGPPVAMGGISKAASKSWMK
jgi:hypothetical protein